MARKNKAQAQVQEASKPNKMEKYMIWGLYALIILSVLAYAAYNNAYIGAFGLILIIITLIAEFRLSIKEEGAQKSIFEAVSAIVIVVVAWIIIGIVLQTTNPINVVASCSMLPTLHRGDLVFLHGISNMSQFLTSHHIPVVTVNGSSFTSYTNLSRSWNVFMPYYNNKTSFIAPFGSNPFGSFIPQGSSYNVGLYNFPCVDFYDQKGLYTHFSSCFVNQSLQRYNIVQYNYTLETLDANNGTASKVAMTSAITIANTLIVENYSNPIIVYATVPNDSYPRSDIVHRLVAAVKANGNYYLLTKGDNNPYLDLQVGNYPINQTSTIGYVIGSVPVLGYVKILLSGQLSSVAGCNQTIVR